MAHQLLEETSPADQPLLREATVARAACDVNRGQGSSAGLIARFQRSSVDRLLALSRRNKRLLAVGLDAAICVWSCWAAFYLRLGEWMWLTGTQWLTVVLAIGLAIPIFGAFGLYRAIFRHTGWPSAVAVSSACLIYGVIYAMIFTFIGVSGTPRTIGFIQPIMLFLTIAMSRGLAHVYLGGRYQGILRREAGRKVLIYGAGVSGRQLAAVLAPSQDMRVVGFLDDDRSLLGGTVDGHLVRDPRDLGALVAAFGITDVLLAIPSASRKRRRQILDLLRPACVNVCTVPGLLDLAKGHLTVDELRPVDVEDLLGRDAVEPDHRLLRERIAGKVVMVTGAGGSIGSELCRKIHETQPSLLIVVEVSEYSLYAIREELSALGALKPGPTIVPLLASVQDEQRMRAIVDAWRPSTIYHAAAYKHVPLVELNPTEGIKNNVFGTLTLARLAIEFDVDDFILVSTDKAVRPTNVMGASKRLAEMVLQAHAATLSAPRFSIVRFGNVLGSSGSVVPLFRQQIERGGPVTVTHNDVTRYFMTIAEAAQLVIQAGAMANGGEVFLLDMGEPVRVIDLARNMINLSGLSVRDDDNPDGDIEISTVGLRPGEKLYEELLIGEGAKPTRHERIFQARERFTELEELDSMLQSLAQALDRGDAQRAVMLLRGLVPEYQPSEEIAFMLASAPKPSAADTTPLRFKSRRLPTRASAPAREDYARGDAL